jgi:hypothetical protein
MYGMELNIKKIEDELKRIGMNRNQFAIEKGISRQYFWYLLNGDVTLKKVETLGSLFGLDPKDLLV